MKPYIFIFCLLLAATFSHAQYQYVPMPTANATWMAINQIAATKTAHCHKYQFSLTGDNEINGTDTFHVVKVRLAYMNYDITNPPGRPDPVEAREFVSSCYGEYPFEKPITISGTAGSKKLLFIEKDKRLYVLDSTYLDTTVHKAHVDFNLSYVGEVINRSSPDTVLSIDTININGTLRRRIVTTYHSFFPYSKNDTLIEGIGSLRFALGFKELLYEGSDMQAKGKVYCFSVNNIQEYTYKNSACAPIWLTGINTIEQVHLAQVSPNPFADKITISNPGIGVVNVYNTLGSCIYSINTNDSTLNIRTENWPPGLYIIGIQSESGTRSFKVTKY